MKTNSTFAFAGLFLAACLIMAGCAGDQPAADNDSGESTSTTVADPTHGGWWCVEHAIPEEECSMCSASYAKECKDKGDWCEEHNRAKSQCFKCDPSLAEKYVKLYEAKYGKKPPAATE